MALFGGAVSAGADVGYTPMDSTAGYGADALDASSGFFGEPGSVQRALVIELGVALVIVWFAYFAARSY